LPFGIALMISLYTRYEEQIGHFNHLLQLPRRDKWLLNMMSFSWVSVGVSTFISCVPLWLLVGDTFSKFIIYYLLLTTLFSLPFIIILWFVALKMNMSLCLGMGVFLSLYLILFGANSLGDTIWTYIPLLYGTRFLYVIGISDSLSFFIFIIFLGMVFFLSLYLILFGANSLGYTILTYISLLYGTRFLYVIGISDSLSFFIFSIFLLFTGLLLVIVIMWFNRWEGRTINE